MIALLLLSILVLHDDSGFPLPPCEDCRVMHVAGAPGDPAGSRVDTVILSGHSTYGRYLGLDGASVADRLARLAPRAIVLDTCFGAQAEFIIALFDASPALEEVVAVADWLPPGGLDYGPPFASQDRLRSASIACCGQRRRAVTSFTTEHVELLRWLVVWTRLRSRWCLLDEPWLSIMPNLLRVSTDRMPGPVLVHVPPQDVGLTCAR